MAGWNPLRLLPVRAGEGATVAWSFLYFFCLLAGYYVIRPVRDTMGVTGGVDQLQWLFTGTFLAMCVAVPVYGWLAGRHARAVLLPLVYGFFIACLLGFYFAFRAGAAEVILARAFFIWTSVFNLFVVSVFWTFMADIYRRDDAHRLFGLIAAGGSAGAILGPSLTTLLAEPLGTYRLLLVSAALLGVALLAITRLRHQARRHAGGEHAAALGGRALDGVRHLLASRYLAGIGAFIVLYTLISTFLYFQQAIIVEDAFATRDERTSAFALIDLLTNSLTLGLQFFATHHLVRRLGLDRALGLIPLIVAAGFLVLAWMPVFGVLMGFQVLRRAGNYALTKPGREMLFTVVSREDKYKAKNVIDTLVYRGGDAVSGWLFSGLKTLGLGLSGTAVIAAGVSLIWMSLGVWLGRRQAERARQAVEEPVVHSEVDDEAF
jgi:AAA family ATP:ADP antiporter